MNIDIGVVIDILSFTHKTKVKSCMTIKLLFSQNFPFTINTHMMYYSGYFIYPL